MLFRSKHRKPFVNLPSTRVIYGEEVRSCIISREGRKFVCSDLSSMENIWKFNYQMPHDPEFVKSQQAEDHDPHLGIAPVEVVEELVDLDDVESTKPPSGGVSAVPKTGEQVVAQTAPSAPQPAVSPNEQAIQVSAEAVGAGSIDPASYAALDAEIGSLLSK